MLFSLEAIVTDRASSACLLSIIARVVASALIRSSLPMRCRGLETAPLLFQRRGSGKAVARLPAHDYADAPLDTPRKLVPLERRQQGRGHRRIVVVAQRVLQPGDAGEETLYLVILPLGVQEELRGIWQLLQGYPDLVTVFRSKAPKMRPLPHDLPMQLRKGAAGEVVGGLQQSGEGFALQLIAPAARMDPLAYRQLQPVVSRAGKRLAETCIGGGAMRAAAACQRQTLAAPRTAPFATRPEWTRLLPRPARAADLGDQIVTAIATAALAGRAWSMRTTATDAGLVSGHRRGSAPKRSSSR